MSQTGSNAKSNPVARVTNDDKDSRMTWLAEGNATQARKRVAAKGVIANESDQFLLVNPTYKDYWDLPGGMADANEPPGQALIREVAEELGVEVQVGRLLALDWVGPHGPWDDELVFVFETNVLTRELVRNLHIVDNEVSDFGFFSLHEARQRLREDVGARLARAVHAMNTDRTRYTEKRDPGDSE